MNPELVARDDSKEIDQEKQPEVLERLLKRGELEMVTTSSGEVLYILQSVDE